MLTTEKIRITIESIAEKYGIKKVTLFGSRATKNFRENSENEYSIIIYLGRSDE